MTWSIVDAHSDYNGDGKSDMLWRNSADGAVSVWQMNGAQLEINQTLANLPAPWSIIDTHGDYNGDGKNDILLRNGADGALSVWQMNGAQIEVNQTLANVPMTWSIVDAHSDYNGDGKSDMLWRNSADGAVSVWQMNGTQIANNQPVATVPTVWRVIDGTEAGASIFGDGSGNILTGTVNNDTIAGGGGNDTMTGGAGSDQFVFNTALNATINVDTITDFTPGTDKIFLDHSIFTMLPIGEVGFGSFVSGAGVTTATDGDDYLIYNNTTGALYYDSDGLGAATPTQFAVLAGGASLQAGYFLVG
jgi:Ca2+-binding RTX toxin-like protein